MFAIVLVCLILKHIVIECFKFWMWFFFQASKDGEDDDEENISTFGGDRDRRKPSSSLLLRQNDDVEWDSDDVADTTYKPTVKTTASSKHVKTLFCQKMMFLSFEL